MRLDHDEPTDARMKRKTSSLRRLVDASLRIVSEQEVEAILRITTEAAKDLVDSLRAATSLSPGEAGFKAMHVFSGFDLPTNGWGSREPEDMDLSAVLGDADGPIRLTKDHLEADPGRRTLRMFGVDVPSPNGRLAVPIVARDGRVLGCVQSWDKVEGEFDEEDEDHLVQLSRFAAVAIENAQGRRDLRGDAERKDEFLAILAHELRNPLAAIGSAARLAAECEAISETSWAMEVVSRQLRILSRLADDLMDVSRLARGKVRLRRVVLEAAPILRGAAAVVGPLVEKRKHTLELALDDGDLWVDADPTRLEQVVTNLLTNAAKYSDDGGRIRLAARREGDEVVIRVQDGGFGIPPEKLLEMFDLFAQGDGGAVRADGGLGIGLALVKRLVELHDGTVKAESDGPGRGSEFVIRLPAAERPVDGRHLQDGPAKSLDGSARPE